MPADPGAPQQVEVDVDGHRMHLLAGYAEQPRAVLFALHGGSSGKEYFDSPLDDDLSLVRLGPRLGVTVLAVDRPGYGPDGVFQDTMSPEDRTDLLFGTLDAALDGRGRGGGVVLVCHSMGCVSGVRMAADPRGRDLLGLELTGTGLQLSAAARSWAVGRDHAGGELRRLVWGPDHLYPPDTRRSMRLAPGPSSEGPDNEGWGAELPARAPDVCVPVRFALAEHESWWRAGPEALAEVAALFTGAPSVETAIELGAGHNTSLGFTARAYHLRVLAFAERCLAARVAPGPTAEQDTTGSRATGPWTRGAQ